MNMRVRVVCVCVAILAGAAPLEAVEITIRVENLSHTDGFWLSPLWVGFHDGSFTLFELGTHTQPGGDLERLAEDGNPQPLQAQFARQTPGGTSGVIAAPGGLGDVVLFGPGETASMQFDLDPKTQRFMDYAAMVAPSNDAFIGSDDGHTIILWNEAGMWYGNQVIQVDGCYIWDAGTEANTERDAAFLDQTQPNQGIPTLVDIVKHEGLTPYNPDGGTILGSTNDLGIYFEPFAADFIEGNRPVVRITIIIPEPATLLLLAVGGAAVLSTRRRSAWP